MQARYYDPVVGRFYSNDPVDALGHMQRGNSIAHGFNRYAYANNNPYKYTDPDGELPVAGWLIAGGLAALADYGTQVAGNIADGKGIIDSLTDVDGKSIAISGVAGAAGANGVKLLKTALSGSNKAGKIDSKAARAVIAADGASKAGAAAALKADAKGEDPAVGAVKGVVDAISPVPIADNAEGVINDLMDNKEIKENE